MKKVRVTQPSFQLMKYFFLCSGLSAIFAGFVGHAFLYAFTEEWKLPAWILTMISITLVAISVILNVQNVRNNNFNKFVIWVVLIELPIAIYLTIFSNNFYWVMLHIAFGLIITVASYEIFHFVKTNEKGSKYMLIGVLIIVIAATVYQLQITIGQWFNHIDLSHCLIALSSYFLYIGSLNRSDYSNEKSPIEVIFKPVVIEKPQE